MDFSKVREALEARGFSVAVCPTKEAASEYLNEKIDGMTVGFGGSMTLGEMGLYDSLSRHNTMHDHWHVPKGCSPDEARVAAMSTEVYLTSANGLAETGELINIDGTGNRVAATLYGHEEVWFVVGVNKIAPDYAAALWRARNIASPKNAQRIGTKTPCAAKGDKCYDCHSPERICRGVVTLLKKPTGIKRAYVVLVEEELGY